MKAQLKVRAADIEAQDVMDLPALGSCVVQGTTRSGKHQVYVWPEGRAGAIAFRDTAWCIVMREVGTPLCEVVIPGRELS